MNGIFAWMTSFFTCSLEHFRKEVFAWLVAKCFLLDCQMCLVHIKGKILFKVYWWFPDPVRFARKRLTATFLFNHFPPYFKKMWFSRSSWFPNVKWKMSKKGIASSNAVYLAHIQLYCPPSALSKARGCVTSLYNLKFLLIWARISASSSFLRCTVNGKFREFYTQT